MASSKENLLRRFFAGLTEQTFEGRLGVADPLLLDYLVELLCRFAQAERMFRIRTVRGQQLFEAADMLWEAQQRIGDARREIYRHIGDFTLFWTGVYPETLSSHSTNQRAKDRLLDYTAQGKRSYYLASTLGTEQNATESEVLARLSTQFEMCAYGLGEVRREWERRDDTDTGIRPLLLD